MRQPLTFAAHDFTMQDWDEGRMPFVPNDYSLLKFGCDATMKRFGWAVAEGFFAQHRDLLMKRQAVIMPSPYNFVPNAAMVMSNHMIDRLNHLVVGAGGPPVEFSLIRRKLTFTTDYGFLSKEERVALLTKDEMYLNEHYLKGKTLIFSDDIRITGTNELCMETLVNRHSSLDDNELVFLYFARLVGEVRPDVEAQLNLSSIRTLRDYLELTRQPNHHIIVRPIKFALSQPAEDFRAFVLMASMETLLGLYYGSMGEGFYDKQGFVENFSYLRGYLDRRGWLASEVFPSEMVTA